MSARGEEFTIGVEEEYQIVDPETRELRPRAWRVVPEARRAVGDEAQHELYLSQIEACTPVCRTLAEVRGEVVRLRRAMIEAAAKDDKVIAAAGTHPFSHWGEQKLTPKPRYWQSAADFQQLMRELVIFGCHVHVGLNDRDTAVEVLNRVRPWLATMLALSSNSPFWLGADTGYASFRTELWGRFPQSGVPHAFESRAEYDALVRTLVETGSIQDATRIYWDVRLPEKTPTIELRVTDVCMRVDEAVMIAAFARGLVRTCHEQAVRDEPWTAVRPELLRAAHWRAARYGLEQELIDVEAGRAVPACEMVERLLRFVQPTLEETGDWEEASGLLRATMQDGTGAVRQRKAYERAGRMEDVVDLIVAETAKGVINGGTG